MRIYPPLFLTPLALILIGCGSAGSSIDGRSVTSRCIIYTTIASNGHEANINLCGAKLQVTPTQLTWNTNDSLHLPNDWHNLKLAENLDAIAVNIDGNHFANIHPLK
jgi:hypothetical protein